jgi:hypothetical protein
MGSPRVRHIVDRPYAASQEKGSQTAASYREFSSKSYPSPLRDQHTRLGNGPSATSDTSSGPHGFSQCRTDTAMRSGRETCIWTCPRGLSPLRIDSRRNLSGHLAVHQVLPLTKNTSGSSTDTSRSSERAVSNQVGYTTESALALHGDVYEFTVYSNYSSLCLSGHCFRVGSNIARFGPAKG